MPFCKYCGAGHDDDAVFCTACGKPIMKKTAPPEKMIQEMPRATKTEEIVRVEDAERHIFPATL